MGFSIFGDLVADTAEQRRTFFKLLFGKAEGYVCLAYLNRDDRKMRQRFFKWPQQIEDLLSNIDLESQQLVHAYYGVSLYNTNSNRTKDNVKQCTTIWADLDNTNPATLLVKPSILVQSSPGKLQGLWLLEDPIDPFDAEDIARRISYYHHNDGADYCWDATHILRIPYTPNYKYGDLDSAPIVTVLDADRRLYRPSDFSRYPQPKAIEHIVAVPPEERVPSSRPAEDIMEEWYVSDYARHLIEDPVPEEDTWSERLWSLITTLRDDHCPKEEAFVIVKGSKCDKYTRDGRPDSHLWKEIDKAYIEKVEVMKLAPTATASVPDFITTEEINQVTARETFIERYISWASKQTDAATQYHQAGAFIILSAILAGNITLPTSFGKIIPNLWFMILGNTTLTRKTTSMNMAMRLLYDVDDRALLATDGSLEGILVGLRDRPHQSSIFKRDEFSGLLETIAHKDYMAGFAEQLTQLYDGEQIKRMLRKEVIDIHNPVFIMYVGGIKAKTQMLLTEELVMGGFLPRFVMITAEPDLSRLRPLGPPVETETEHRDIIKNELLDIFAHYVAETNVTRNGSSIGRARPDFEAVLTPEAWTRYNQFERLMSETALNTGLEYLTPVYDRLSKSTLKAAMLIAASTQRGSKVIVTLQDLLHAIYYCQFWREYGSEIINGVGKTYDERLMDKIFLTINSSMPLGTSRGELMTMFQLDAKRADLLFKTLEQRKLIKMVDTDGGKRYQVP